MTFQKFSVVQRRIQNPAKHVRWSVLWKLSAVNYFRKKLHLRYLTEPSVHFCSHFQNHQASSGELVLEYFRFFVIFLFYRSATLMDKGWSLNKQSFLSKFFWNLSNNFNRNNDGLFMRFSKVNLSSTVNPRSSIVFLLYFHVIDKILRFCRILFKVVIVCNFWEWTIGWFESFNRCTV